MGLSLTPVPAAPSEPQESATATAAREALENLRTTGSALPPRNADGTFAPKAGDPPPPTGQAPAAGEPTEEQPEGQPATPAAPARQETPEPAPATEPPAAEEPPAKPLTVELRDRNGQPMELELGDEQTADMVRSYINAAERGRAAEAQLGEATQILDTYAAEREEMFADPIGFLDRNGLTKDPAFVEHLILSLTAEHWDRVRDKVVALDDPLELRTVKAETKARRMELGSEIRETLAEQRAVNQNLTEITGAVDTLRPAGMSPAQARVFETACLQSIKAYADHYQLLTVPVDQLPAILGETLAAWDIDAATAAELLGTAAGSSGRRPSAPTARPVARPATPSAPARPAAAARPAVPAKPAPNGQRFVASARRKAAAASPPPGAGSPGTGPVAPPRTKDGKPMGIADTIAWHRANRGRLTPRS